MNTNRKDVSYWLSPDGELIESSEQEHVNAVAKIFDIPFVPDKTILYYRIAFENNYIRVFQTKKKELNIQLTKPATSKQKKVLKSIFEDSTRCIVVFGSSDSEILFKNDLNKMLSGNIDIVA